MFKIKKFGMQMSCWRHQKRHSVPLLILSQQRFWKGSWEPSV